MAVFYVNVWKDGSISVDRKQIKGALPIITAHTRKKAWKLVLEDAVEEDGEVFFPSIRYADTDEQIDAFIDMQKHIQTKMFRREVNARKEYPNRTLKEHDGYNSIKMSPQLKSMIESQFEAFEQKFGRKPSGNDPLFFDPNCDYPRPLTEEQLSELYEEAPQFLRDAGYTEEEVFIFEKTGYQVHSPNLSQEAQEEIEAARLLYKSMSN